MARGRYSYREKMDALVKAKRAELDKSKGISNRKAGDVITDDLLEEVRQLGLKQDADEEFQEQMRQLGIAEQIHGKKPLAAFLDPANPSRTVEQQIGRQMVQNGVVPASIPADRILGINAQDIPQSGIDGQFKDDSEVRRHVTGELNDDVLDLTRKDVYTEFLSPRGRQQAYDDWEPYNSRQNSLSFFNRAASEYYGQQALRLTGATPVSNKDRSKATQWHGHQGNPASTINTDRLIENSSQLTSKDTDFSGDFRYYDKDGKLTVGDNQTGELNPDGSVNFNILKKSNLGGADMNQVKSQMVDIAQEYKRQGISPTLDLILGKMMQKGDLAPLVKGARGVGTRAGKLTSSGNIMGAENDNDQYRYEKILYPITPKGAIHHDEGYLPESFRMFDTEKIRSALGKLLAKGGDGINLFQHGKAGDIQLSVPVPMSNPNGYLRDNSLNRQFSQGYSFGKVDPTLFAVEKPAFDFVDTGIKLEPQYTDTDPDPSELTLGGILRGVMPF